MGSYYGIHTRITTKKEASKETLDFLEVIHSGIVGTESIILPTLVPPRYIKESDAHDFIGEVENIAFYLSLNVNGGSAYFANWEHRSKEQSDDKGLIFESFASSKTTHFDTWLLILNSIKNDLDLEHGEVCVRSIYEDSLQEMVIFYDAISNQFYLTNGYKHKSSRYGEIIDPSTHPYNEEEGNHRFVPAMNIYELYPEYSEYKIELDERGYSALCFKFVPSIRVGNQDSILEVK